MLFNNWLADQFWNHYPTKYKRVSIGQDRMTTTDQIRLWQVFESFNIDLCMELSIRDGFSRWNFHPSKSKTSGSNCKSLAIKKFTKRTPVCAKRVPLLSQNLNIQLEAIKREEEKPFIFRAWNESEFKPGNDADRSAWVAHRTTYGSNLEIARLNGGKLHCKQYQNCVRVRTSLRL